MGIPKERPTRVLHICHLSYFDSYTSYLTRHSPYLSNAPSMLSKASLNASSPRVPNSELPAISTLAPAAAASCAVCVLTPPSTAM